MESGLHYSFIFVQVMNSLLKGKPKILIIDAAMRKLVYIIYGVLKNNTPFNSNIIVKNA